MLLTRVYVSQSSLFYYRNRNDTDVLLKVTLRDKSKTSRQLILKFLGHNLRGKPWRSKCFPLVLSALLYQLSYTQITKLFRRKSVYKLSNTDSNFKKF